MRGRAATSPDRVSIHRSRRRWSAFFSFLVILAVAISCQTVSRTIMAPPRIPGATFVGSESCDTCHSEVFKEFKHDSTHGRLMAKGENAGDMGCESCHGPGSLHVESGGKRGTIVNPDKSPETCFQCHLDKQAEFRLPHSHPVLAGHVTCTDCHDPHKGEAISAGGTQMESQNETCLECHKLQRGPFVYEHEALREGCTTCHSPHGSPNQKMLRERNANLCLKCHAQQQTTFGQILIGGRNHAGSMARGTCWSVGCHEAVHGSQVHPSLRF